MLGAVAMLLAGCATTAPETEATEAAIPDTRVGVTAAWVLEVMNADRDTTVQQWEGRLHEDFTAQVSADEVAELINVQIRPARPLVPTAYRGTESEAVVTVEGSIGEPFDLSLVVDDDDRITGMLLGPVTPEREPAASLDEVEERLAALPGETRALVLRDGETVIERDADAASPIGSMFKLYVLDAVAEAVTAGRTAWDAPLTITDDIRSLPSGELQDAPTGTTVTVREAAEKMIAISDNTATDLLIAHVGRGAVEAAVARLDHHAPSLLAPFPTTREFFALLWGDDEDLVATWGDGDEQERRAVLAELAERPFTVTVADADDEPRWPEGLEWFASARDIAAAHDALAERAASDDAVATALTANPGLALDAAAWPTIAFKGGSSPGVLAGSWRAQAEDGTAVTVVVLSSDPDSPITSETQAELFGLVEDVYTLLP